MTELSTLSHDELVTLILDAIDTAQRVLPQDRKEDLAEALRGRARQLEDRVTTETGFGTVEAERRRNAQERALREVMHANHIASVAFWSRGSADRRIYINTEPLGGTRKHPVVFTWCFYLDGSNRVAPGWHREDSWRGTKWDRYPYQIDEVAAQALDTPEPPTEVLEALAAVAEGDWKTFRGRIYA